MELRIIPLALNEKILSFSISFDSMSYNKLNGHLAPHHMIEDYIKIAILANTQKVNRKSNKDYDEL